MSIREEKPVIAITIGDPAGIGPEITVKLLSSPWVYSVCHPVVIGDLCAVHRALEQTGSKLDIRVIDDPGNADFDTRQINLIDMKCLNAGEYEMGEVNPACGNAAYRYVKEAIRLAMEKRVDATVTAPLNKEAMNLAGHHYSGHTEIYAELTGTKEYAMMLACGSMRVAHVSTHVSLREACDRVKKERILKVIRLADQACRDLGIDLPKIAVAGLNPHCGEGGLFGREELEEIGPAVEAARQLGLRAEGPVPPDTVFSKLKGGLYDICVCMYHDQGHIPIKLAGFIWESGSVSNEINGINMTLGLPIIRVSVDHGTAFDIAGKNIASEASMVSAVEYAAVMARARI